MTNEAIAWIGNEQAADPEKPWFVYFSTAGVHAPHQVTPEWREKFKGKFDYGWDKQRELTFAKQLELGIIPKGTKLTPRPKKIPAWDDQSEDAKKVYTRLMENYAAYMAYTDYEVGRLIDSLVASGELDNTLVIYIVGDNGASAEGGLEGTFSELASLLGVQLGLQSTINRIDEIGGPTSEPHVPVGWAWAMDAPFQWTKQVASHLGGTRNPLVVHWPKGIKSKGEIRTQFHHVIDVVPTILEAAKIEAPGEVKGIAQKPIEGISIAYSFDDAAAKDRRRTQYFEMLTNRAIYDHGWVAASRFGYRGRLLGARVIFSTRRGNSTISTRISARQTTSPPRTRISSRSSKRSSTRKPRNTTSIRSTPGCRSGSTRNCVKADRRRRTGPITATVCGCLSRSDRNSSREVTRSRPN